MNINKIAKKVHAIAPSVKVEEYRGCVRLTGELDNWDDIFNCGMAAVSKKSLGVLNDIRLKDFKDKIRVPSFSDNKLDGVTPDVLVIGGGIVGCAIARELTKLKLTCLVVEKGNDVACATSSRNDGCVHVGIDLHKGQQKLKYVERGNQLYTQLAEDLELQLGRWAQILVYDEPWEKYVIAPAMKLKAKLLGLKGFKFVTREELAKIEPCIPSWMDGAMYMSTGAVCSPYKTTIALAENAIMNGAQVSLNTMVQDMSVVNGEIKAVKTNRGTIYPKLVINASGTYADIIADMAGDRTFTIHPRKGTDIILDKKKAYSVKSSLARSPFSKTPESALPLGDAKVAEHTKGGGVMRTVDGNVLVGPDAEEVPYREDNTTSMSHIENIIRKQSLVLEDLKKSDIITYFSGCRAATYEEDFVVRKGIFTKNIIEAAGIQSPGVTAAPAIAEDVRKWTQEFLDVPENKSFNPKRHHTPRLADLSDEEREMYIKKNPQYGEIICRCEEVSKGEIIDALEAPLKVPTIDGIKRRVRPGMGRCQGGFCSPLVAKIIAEHEGIPVEEVLKGEEGSVILYGNTKKALDDMEEEK